MSILLYFLPCICGCSFKNRFASIMTTRSKVVSKQAVPILKEQYG